MPVLEVTCLRATRLAVDDPKVLQSLTAVRGQLQTNSQFYSCIEDPAIVYILGMWPDLDTHLVFLSSPTAGEILGPQEDVLSFEWTTHMELDSMQSLPLDAPILAIERVIVDQNCADAFNYAATNHLRHSGGSHPRKLAFGWRIDAPVESHEAIIFTGWATVQAHVTFAAWQTCLGDGDPAKIRGQYEVLVSHHGINLERE